MQREKEKLLRSEPFRQWGHPAKHEVAEFILAAYHRDSPLIRAYPSVVERRRAAVRQAGLPEGLPWVQALVTFESVPEPAPPAADGPDGGVFAPSAAPDQGHNLLIREVVNLTHHFLQNIQSSNQFESLTSNQTVFWEFQRMMREPIFTADDDKRLKAALLKSTLSGESEKIMERIQKSLSQIYADDEELLSDAEKMLRVTPERMARQHAHTV